MSVQLSAFENPQRFGGSDIMHRISYDGQHPGELRQALVKALNHEIENPLSARWLCAGRRFTKSWSLATRPCATCSSASTCRASAKSPTNRALEHEYLSGERTATSLVEKTRRLGLKANPKARAYSLPLIASHVGADVAADLVAVDMDLSSESAMLVDVGTNTEVVVAPPRPSRRSVLPGRPSL